ncbi:MAG: enoyl-CoA hydratase-related protein [Dehalococcoidales bacterium]|nr:enoyl-CoA hydratase-related protein [Dehalococcoidales bacterium]
MAVTKFDCVEYERKGEITVITMNNPSRRNSMSFLMQRGLNGAFGQFEEDDDAKVAILTGVGNSFNAGWDTKDQVMMSDEEKRSIARERTKISRTGAWTHMNRIPKPIIAAVNGYAVGWGWFVANNCDMVIAAESALFWQNEPVFGYQGGGQAVATQMLPFHIGVEISLAAKMTAKRCYEIGLVNRVVPDAELMNAAMKMAQHICGLAPLSVRIVVESCRSARLSSAIPSVTALSSWQESYYLGGTEDVKEGFKAFAEKRKPNWKGR